MTEPESGTNIAIELLGVMDPQDKIDTCHEWTRWRFRSLVCCLALLGFGQVRVTCGRRTFEEQCVLYGKGRSADEMAVLGISGGYAAPGKPRVSWLDPRCSAHVMGRAIDLSWSGYEDPDFLGVATICRELGITWGGVWSVRDYCHFEI